MDFCGYCVRVDARDGYREKLTMLSMHTDYEAIVAVKHKGAYNENEHYHLVIKTAVKDQAMRVRLRKVFDAGKGNGHMSIKPWDGRQEAIAYLFHEDPDAELLLQHNVSDAVITEAKLINRQVQQMVLDAKTKASWRAEEIVYQEIVDDRTRRPRTGYNSMMAPPPPWEVLSDTQIAKRLILVCLRTGKYTPQPWLIRAMTERIQFRLLNGVDEDEDKFALRLAQNIFYRDV